MVHSVRERERQNDREREKDRMLQKRKHEGEERGRKKEKRVATKVAMTDKETRSREKRRQKCILQVRQHLSGPISQIHFNSSIFKYFVQLEAFIFGVWRVLVQNR
ncbi:hypothetical protein AAHE18_04G188400 [Arachis hypogaea]